MTSFEQLIIDDPIHPVYKVALLVDLLRARGIPDKTALAGAGISKSALASADTRISMRQLTQVYRNVVNSVGDPAFGIIAGQHIRITHYGMYGYALLSSENLNDALAFAIKYHQLATPTTRLSFHVENEIAAFTVANEIIAPDVEQFNIDFQMSLIASLLRDILGEPFSPREICFSYPIPVDRGPYEPAFGCPVTFDKPHNELRFDAAWLDYSLHRSNPITVEMATELCEHTLQAQVSTLSIEQQVHRLLMEAAADMPDIQSAAEMLKMTSRALRRKLQQRGVSYQQIVAATRKQLAIEYLQSTYMKDEDIAERIGFSDAANFRRAFKKWTGETPNAYREAENQQR